MRVLITGITGFAGSHLQDYILQNNLADVYGIKRTRSNVEFIDDRSHIFECDITDYFSVAKVLRELVPDVIFHLAAQSYVPVSWTSPGATIEANFIGTLNILEAMRLFCPKSTMLFAGTSEEYGMVEPNDCPITESQPLLPLSPYAVSKVGAEYLCRQYVASYGLRVITTRAFNHTGPRRGEVFATSNFAKQIVEIERGYKDPVLYVGNLEAKRDFTDIRDMVAAYWAASLMCEPGQPYNICSGNSISISNMLHMLLGLSLERISVQNDPARIRPSDVPLLHGCNRKFRDATGWMFKYSLKQTLEDLLDYWRTRL